MHKIDCLVCGKENLTHNEIGLCKKLLGRNIEKFFCIDCLAEYLNVTLEELNDRMEIFKEEGCTLFK
jgi:uncharacterized protein YlaI